MRSDAPYWLYEFWQEQYLGSFQGQLDCEVAPNSCRLYRIAKARRHPWLLSTDMHVQQGHVEIASMKWDRKRMTLTGTATRPKGERGNLCFVMPRGHRLVNYEGHQLLKYGTDMSVVIRKEIHFTKKEVAWELQFETLNYTTAYA